jgi:hypothetical protein
MIDGTKSTNQIISALEEKFPGVDLKKDVVTFIEHAYGKGWFSAN